MVRTPRDFDGMGVAGTCAAKRALGADRDFGLEEGGRIRGHPGHVKPGNHLHGQAQP